MSDQTCAALDWDKTSKDYIECSPTSTIRCFNINSLIAVRVWLCERHADIFKKELDGFGGGLSASPVMKEVEGADEPR